MIEEKKILNDWKVKKLGDVFKTTSGGTPSRKNSAYYSGNIPWVKSGELESNILINTEEKISEEAIQNSSAKIFPKGTLLIALYGATIGKLAKLGIDAATNQAVCGIFENEEHDLQYLYWFLFFKRRDLIKAGIGGAQPNISQTILKNLDIPLPKKTIQQLVVSKIEELFSELDKGMEQLKTAQQQLKVYRQSVLKWAFEGRLTKQWRHENLNHDLPDLPDEHDVNNQGNHANSKNQGSDNDLPKEWKWVKLGQVCEKVTIIKKGKKSNEKFYYLDIGAIDNNLNKIVSHKEYEWKDAPSRAQQIVYKNDLLFSTVRTYLKKIAMIESGIYNGQIASSGFTVIRSIQNILLPKYIFYYSLSNDFLEPLNQLQTGSSYPAVRDSDVFAQLIPLASLIEQHQIVQQIESRLSVADKLEETITNSLQQAAALRQSILKKAFEGKLI